MHLLQLTDLNAVSGAASGKLNLSDILGMLDAGYTVAKIAKIGLETATEECRPEWGNNTAGDSGYYLTDNGGPVPRITRWFFDGNGYYVN